MKKLFSIFFVSILFISTNIGWGQTTIFIVDGGGTLPTGWTSTNVAGTNDIDKGSYYLVEAGDPSDIITTTTYNLNGYTNVQLNLRVATYGSGTANPCTIEVSTDGGTTWTQSYTSNTPSSSSYIDGGPIYITSVNSTTVIKFSNAGTSGRGVRLQNLILTGIAPVAGPPVKLSIPDINSGNLPSAMEPFSVTITALDNSDFPANVSANTDISLSVATGTGVINGTVTGTIPAGNNSVTISGVTYNTAESGVSVTASRTSGDVLSSATSSTFTVLEAASKLVFVNAPTSGQQNLSLNPFNVEAQRTDNSVDLNFSGDITIAKETGSGNIAGTLTKAASSGSATFNDISFDAGGTYTISASSTGLTGITSGSINILATSLPLVEEFNYTPGTTLADNGWDANSGAGTNSITVSSGALTYNGYASSGSGNKVTLLGSGEDVNRTFDQVDTNSIYVFFLVNVSSASTTGDYFLALSTNPLSSYSARIFAEDDGSGNLLFGIAKASSANYAAGTYTYNTTHLIVVKYTFNSTTNDDVTGIYIDPAMPGDEPASFDAEGTASEGDANGIGSVLLRQGGSSSAPSLSLSGIRIGTSWNSPLPVELTSLTASEMANGVNLKWNTATEINNYGFEVQRKNGSSDVWNKITFVKGNGNSNSPKAYSFIDKNVNSGKYYYRLKQIDFDGKSSFSKVVEINISTPEAYKLNQNYPNPFNPVTTIKYEIPKAGKVRLVIFDMLGREVETIVNEYKEAGRYNVQFNANKFASGTYLYEIQTGNFVQVKKMILLK